MKRLLVLLAFCGLAHAQPYLAAGGFGRPTRIATTSTTTDVALAAESGVAYAFWVGSDGVVRQALGGPAVGQRELVLENPYVRSVAAVTVDDSVALAWVDRSNRTGRSRHAVRWRGETHVILDAAAPRPFAVGAGREGPVVLLVRHAEGEDVLTLTPWEGRPVEIARSARSIEDPAVTMNETGGYHVAWLEGLRNVQANGQTQLGWQARYRSVAADGELGPVLSLGPAAEPGLTRPIRVGVAAGQPFVMWNYVSQAKGEQGLAVGVPGASMRLIAPAGHAIGVWDGFAYWAQGESVRRRALAAAGTPGEAENVLWSASPIERAAGMQAQGDLYLLWYGPTPGVVGADFALFLADTRTPFVPGWRDHLAARLGWNPWTFWQALGGQVLGSLFVSVAAALLSLPLFWLLGLLFGGRGAGQGVLLSVGVVVILCVLMYARSRTLPAGPWQLALSLLVAGAVAYPLTRRANTEVQTQTLLGALLTTFVAVSLLGFLNLQHWLGMWSALGG